MLSWWGTFRSTCSKRSRIFYTNTPLPTIIFSLYALAFPRMFLASEMFWSTKKNLVASGIRSKCLSTFPLNLFLLRGTPLSQAPTIECKYVATNRFYDYCHCNSIGEGTVFSVAAYVSSLLRRATRETSATFTTRRNHVASDSAIDRTRVSQSSRSSAFPTLSLLGQVRFSLTSFIWWMCVCNFYTPAK